MLPPQSVQEIQPIVEALRALDRLLDVQWDPKARVVAPGSYSAMGKRIDPVYDGRWSVIRYDSAEYGHAGFHSDRGYTVITEVTEYSELDGVLFMIAHGAYAPIDQRLLTCMRAADAWNVEQHRKLREKLWAQHDANEARQVAIDEGASREALDHNHFEANYAGGVGNWHGKGADFTAMEAKATKAAVQKILIHK